MEKVSIIIPVYNTKEEYLIKCINSLKEQTYKNIEIILIDDGSKIEVAQLCDKIAETDNRIYSFHKKNEGVSVARNYGIEKSTGNWICFVDSDDWMEEDSIENFINNSKESEIILSNIFIDNIKIANKINGRRNIIEKEKINLIKCLLTANSSEYKYPDAVWGKLYKKELLKKGNILFTAGIPRGEDTLFNLEAFYKAKKIMVIDSYTYHYRTNNESVTNKYDEKIIEKYNVLIKNVKKKLGTFSKDDFAEQYHNLVIRCLENACRSYIYNKNNKINICERENILKKLCLEQPYNSTIKKVKLNSLANKRKILVVLLRLKLFNVVSFIYKRYLD